MSKKVSNNLVADIKRDHVMTDRVIYNQLNWEVGNIVKNLNWSINNKQSKIEEIDQIIYDFHASQDDREGGQTEPDWVDLDNKREWHLKQQEVVQKLKDYFIEANSELFPEVKAQAKEDAKARLLKRIA
jgi:hypothetical protein